jgi:uncharacterized membrane protein
MKCFKVMYWVVVFLGAVSPCLKNICSKSNKVVKCMGLLIIVLWLPQAQAQTIVATDDFSSGNFSGGVGWATGSWATTGGPSVVSGEVFSNGGVGRSITRTVDLSGYTSAAWTNR